MKGLGTAVASAAVIMLSGAGGAFAADLGMPVKAVPIAASTTCTSILDFFTTACQLSAYGVRIYGTIDAGFGYQTNSTPFDKMLGPSVNYFPSKFSGLTGGHWLKAANGLTQSNVGVQIKEAIGGGWSFVGQLETQFDPESMEIANSSGSVHENNGRTGFQQTSNGDGSSQGTFYNSLGFAGFSHDTWGTLTFGRQTPFGRDAIAAYDPMQSAYAFSPLGFFGAFGAYGLTEQGRGTTAIKYRVNVSNWHFGVFAQVGGYDEGNSAQGQYLGDIGADWKIGPGVLSADLSGGYTKDGVTIGLTGDPNALGTVPQTVAATISDNTGVMLNAKYTMDKLRLYAGYEWIQYAPPSDLVTSFTDIPGYFLSTSSGPGGASQINNTQYATGDKVLQIAYAGARYALTDSLDVAGAFYHEWQNDYSNGTAKCAITTGASSKCSGTLDSASFLIDYKFAPKWDTYVGVLYSKLNGGFDSGFVARGNVATTAGIRFRF